MNEQAKVPDVLTPAAVAAINEAYAEACRVVRATDRDSELRFRLADRVIFLVRNGELDPRRLTVEAVASVSRDLEARRSEAVIPSAVAIGATSAGEFRDAP